MGFEWQAQSQPKTGGAQILVLVALLLAPFSAIRAQQTPGAPTSRQNQANSAQTGSTQGDTKAAKSGSTDTVASPRGRKLMLKDGSFELVREYEIDGDRVRYYNLDSSQWEVMPASLVDWNATKKAEAEEEKTEAGLLEEVHHQEQERRLMPLDIDASLEVAKGVFLPQGDGLFVFDGNSVVPVTQAQTDTSLAKKRVLEQVLVPIPVVPSRHTISIPGSRAKLRVRSRQPEFYMRTADQRSPDIELIRAKVHNDSREIEHLDEMWGQKAYTRATLPMQRWLVAPGVYRFTLGEPVDPGEYVIAEFVQGIQGQEMGLYVWDFGVDDNAVTAGAIVK
jgi:hypothetical protein